MGCAFGRQDILQLAHQRSLGNQHRSPQIARFNKAVVSGAIAKAKKNGNGDPQQAKRRDGKMDTQLFVPLIADDRDNRHHQVKQQAKDDF